MQESKVVGCFRGVWGAILADGLLNLDPESSPGFGKAAREDHLDGEL